MQLVQEVEEVGGLTFVETPNIEPQITLDYEGVSLTLLGTAHVSKTSAIKVNEMIETGDYDGICLELCENRYRALTDPDAISKMDMLQVIRHGKGSMVMASLALGAFQQRIAEQLGVEPGADMRAALKSAAERELPVYLIDRDIGITFKRIYHNLSWWRRLTVLSGLLASVIARRSVTEEEVEQLKDGDVLESTFKQFESHSEEIYKPLVDERDQYMVSTLMQHAKQKGCKRLLVVVGAGHLKGMRQYFNPQGEQFIRQPEQMQQSLENVPPGGRILKMLPWIIVAIIVAGFVLGFSSSSELGWGMVQTWILINGSLAALGALIACAHPVTIISAFVAAPLTSLNPAIGAGVVSAAVESWFRKPQVRDFSTLRDDASNMKGWWSNRVTRTFLVFFFTGLGSVAGTYFAGYKMFESLGIA